MGDERWVGIDLIVLELIDRGVLAVLANSLVLSELRKGLRDCRTVPSPSLSLSLTEALVVVITGAESLVVGCETLSSEYKVRSI